MAKPRSGKATTKGNAGSRKTKESSSGASAQKQAPVEQQAPVKQIAGVAVMEDPNAPSYAQESPNDGDAGLRELGEGIAALHARFDAMDDRVRHLANFVEDGQVAMRQDFRSDVTHVERLVVDVGDRVAAIEARLISSEVFDKLADEPSAPTAQQSQSASTSSTAIGSTGTVLEELDLVHNEPITPQDLVLEVETEEPVVVTDATVEEIVDDEADDLEEGADEDDEFEGLLDGLEDEDEETEDELEDVLEELEDEDEDEEAVEDEEVILVGEIEDEEEEDEVDEEPVAATNGTAGGFTPARLLRLVLLAESERPNHRITRRHIAAAVRSVATSWTPSRSITDARRLIAAHEHIVAIWDELPDRPIRTHA